MRDDPGAGGRAQSRDRPHNHSGAHFDPRPFLLRWIRVGMRQRKQVPDLVARDRFDELVVGIQ